MRQFVNEEGKWQTEEFITPPKAAARPAAVATPTPKTAPVKIDAIPTQWQARAAVATIEHCSIDLRLNQRAERYRVRWFSESEHNETGRLGYYDPKTDEIGLYVGLDMTGVVETSAHETYHMACAYGVVDRSNEEMRATAYGQMVTRHSRVSFVDGSTYLTRR